MKQQTLFPQENPLRLRNGRYCTKEQYRINKVDEENKILRYRCEKYQRMAIALADSNARLTRELNVLKSKIKDLI